ncbi:helix-turn-helix domain-containing protein [Serratia sp. IR-2025]
MENYIGSRLRVERERLGLSQVAMGDIGGVKKLTQLNYEKGERFPDASYLYAVSKFGADIQFIVTGERSSEALTSDEKELVELFRAAPLAVKAAALAALTAGGAADSKAINVTGGSGQRIAGRDFHEHKK